jgi:hypothetical protein
VPETVSSSEPERIDRSGLWFQNYGLFSDYVLYTHLPRWDEWKNTAEVLSFRKDLLSLYQSQRAYLTAYNEQQTEKNFIEPILHLLGYADSYTVFAPQRRNEKTKHPDFALFPDEKTRAKSYHRLENFDYSRCIAIGDAAHWDRELDFCRDSERDTSPNQNPSAQLIIHLKHTRQKWGILTDGRLWRLYSIESHMPMVNYYQVDILRLLEEAPPEYLSYFYLFFRRSAFTPQNGRCFLDNVIEKSDEYASELKKTVQGQIYDAVQLLCRGLAANFVTEQLTEQKLQEIYNNSLILLYRLLYVLLAEARDILPFYSNEKYRTTVSMQQLAQDIDKQIENETPLSSSSTDYYQRALSLFTLIDKGDTESGITGCNGGLFSPTEHTFLTNTAITDIFFVPALHLLTGVSFQETGTADYIDYKTLDEWRLIPVLEGLLEMKLHTAREDLVLVTKKGRAVYEPAQKHTSRPVVLREDELYLAAKSSEPQAKGTYHTPEHIVDYMVRNTLTPLIQDTRDKVAVLKLEVDASIGQLKKAKEEKPSFELAGKYDQKITQEHERLLEPYLLLKVLDPAMGSGHFLLKASYILAEAMATDPSIHICHSNGDGSDLLHYQRLMVENCMYGVDVNPTAVELAKFLIWVNTILPSKPPAYLNHHFRVGNSLLGAKVSDIGLLPLPKIKGKKVSQEEKDRRQIQLDLFKEALNKKLFLLLQSHSLIAKSPSDTPENIYWKGVWKSAYEQDAERFRILADVWVSSYFGNEVHWDEYNELIEHLKSSQEEWQQFAGSEQVRKAVELRDEKRFFHWELEFPEVFYDQLGNLKRQPGFDAILGNPPFNLPDVKEPGYENERAFYAVREPFSTVTDGKYTYDVLFTALGIWLTRQGGFLSNIVPADIARDAYATNLRNYVMSATRLCSLDIFPQKEAPENRIFKDAEISSCIYILQNERPAMPFLLRIHPGNEIRDTSLQVYVNEENLKLMTHYLLFIPELQELLEAHK